MSDVAMVWVLLALGVLNGLLLLWLLLRRPPADAQAVAQRQQLLDAVQGQAQQTGQRIERVESELRREISESARGGRQEIQQTLATFQETLTRQDAEATRTQSTQLDAFAQQLVQLRGTLGDTLTQQLQAISLGMSQQAQEATRTQNAQIDAFAQQLVQLRGTLADTLTQRLQGVWPDLQVCLVHVGTGRLTPEEAVRLECSPQTPSWIRCVSLRGGGRTRVRARAVIPDWHGYNAWSLVADLGPRPLGEWLFRQTGVLRSPFEWACPENPEGAGSWARRCSFVRHGAPLLLTEWMVDLETTPNRPENGSYTPLTA